MTKIVKHHSEEFEKPINDSEYFFKVDKFKKPRWSPSPSKMQCVLSPKDGEQWSPFKKNDGK